MHDIAALFWETFGSHYPFQVGGLESGALPIVSAIISHGFVQEHTQDITGFYIRKSRKKTGLAQMIEGTVLHNRKIILVDDLMNSGESFIRQVEVLGAQGYSVFAVWVLVRFRDEAYYKYFRERNIALYSVFSLDDFSDTLGTHNLVSTSSPSRSTNYRVIWKFKGADPNYFYVVPKSEILVDESRVYMGTDQGTMWALHKTDGSVIWSYTVGSHAKGKGIFSSPKIHNGVLYFGGYDGNVYALDARTGTKKWISFDADWVGSTPAIAEDLGLLFIGLEFGLIRKRGGIIALDLKTGKKKWWFADMPLFTHATPLYIKEKKQVVIGSNDGAVYLFDAINGKLLWKYQSTILSDDEIASGFSEMDVKASCAYDAAHDRILFLNKKDALVALDRSTGEKKLEFKADFGFYASPLINKTHVYAASLDKHLYCLDLETFALKWQWDAGARIFATPLIIENSLYIGSNSGRLTEIDLETGTELSTLSLTERITNKIAYDPATKHFYVSTYANEIYCVEKIPPTD